MEKFLGHDFIQIAQEFTQLSAHIGPGGDLIISDDKHGKATKWLVEQVKGQCDSVGLKVSAKFLEDLLSRITNQALTYGKLQRELGILVTTIKHEMSTFLLLRVFPGKEEYYEGIQLFGPLVASVFEKIAFDVEEAGKCLALARGTACVFHSMWIMEEGLKSIAKPLGIPYAPSWESYITQITNKVNVKHKTKSRKWKSEEPFFKRVLGDLEAIKIAWRKPTMHIVRTYTASDAEDVFKAVRTFMQELAQRFGPPKFDGMFQQLMSGPVPRLLLPKKGA